MLIQRCVTCWTKKSTFVQNHAKIKKKRRRKKIRERKKLTPKPPNFAKFETAKKANKNAFAKTLLFRV